MMTMESPDYVQMASERTEEIKATIGKLRLATVPEEKIKEIIVKLYDFTPTYAQNFLEDTDPDDYRPWAL